jgi:hypothetical protein
MSSDLNEINDQIKIQINSFENNFKKTGIKSLNKKQEILNKIIELYKKKENIMRLSEKDERALDTARKNLNDVEGDINYMKNHSMQTNYGFTIGGKRKTKSRKSKKSAPKRNRRTYRK